jgi:hypothetical protein
MEVTQGSAPIRILPKTKAQGRKTAELRAFYAFLGEGTAGSPALRTLRGLCTCAKDYAKGWTPRAPALRRLSRWVGARSHRCQAGVPVGLLRLGRRQRIDMLQQGVGTSGQAPVEVSANGAEGLKVVGGRGLQPAGMPRGEPPTLPDPAPRV